MGSSGQVRRGKLRKEHEMFRVVSYNILAESFVRHHERSAGVDAAARRAHARAAPRSVCPWPASGRDRARLCSERATTLASYYYSRDLQASQ